jgi:acetyl esterase/lipase
MAASNFVQFPLPLFLVKKAIRSVRDKAQWQDIQRSRRGFEYMVMKYDYKSKRCDYQTITIDHCKAEWINPHKAPADKVLLYFHGGGYATGSVNTHRAMLTKLALAGNVRILSFEYRLAPENPYPAALEDAVLAYDWVLNNGFRSNGCFFWWRFSRWWIGFGYIVVFARPSKTVAEMCDIAFALDRFNLERTFIHRFACR